MAGAVQDTVAEPSPATAEMAFGESLPGASGDDPSGNWMLIGGDAGPKVTGVASAQFALKPVLLQYPVAYLCAASQKPIVYVPAGTISE